MIISLNIQSPIQTPKLISGNTSGPFFLFVADFKATWGMENLRKPIRQLQKFNGF